MFTSVSKETNHFPVPAENKASTELSKGLTQEMLQANKLKTRAYIEFFLRDIPRAMHKQLVREYNKAIRVYNHSRHKIIEIGRYGYQPSDKLFTVEERLRTATSMFQSIESILKQCPRKKFPEPEKDTRTPEPKTKKFGAELLAIVKRLVIAGALITPAALVACSPQEATQQPIVSTQDLIDQTEDGQIINEDGQEPSPGVENPTEISPAVTADVTPEQLSELNVNINTELQQAVEAADVLTRIRFLNLQNAEAAAEMFANSLTSTENPGGPILDPTAFSVGISPDGVAYLLLTEDSPWGKAGEVAVIDTGKKKGMFVTLAGAGVSEGTLVLDEPGYYAAIKNPQIVKVVDATCQWVELAAAQKLPTADLSMQLAEAYLNGDIEYPAEGLLNEEQRLAFENALAEAEASLTYEQRQNLIEDRWEYGHKAYEALVKEDGNLEYYDGSWHTLEAMHNLNGEIIPWGESYDLLSEEGRNSLITNVLAGDEGMMEKVGRALQGNRNGAGQEGIDHSNFNVLFMQFIPNIKSAVWESVSERIGHYTMNGLIVVKNNQGKLYVIQIETSMGQPIAITHLAGNEIIFHSPYDILKMEAYYEGFLGISSTDLINYLRDGALERAENEEEIEFFEKILASNIEEFLEQLNNNPETISEGLYDVRNAIFFN